MGRNPDNSVISGVEYYHYRDVRFPKQDMYYASTEHDLFVYSKGGLWQLSRYGHVKDVANQCTHSYSQDQQLTRLAACPSHLLEFVPRVVTQYYTHPHNGGFFARRAGQPYILIYSPSPGCGWLWKHYSMTLYDFQKMMDNGYARINLGEDRFPDLDQQISEGLVVNPKPVGKTKARSGP